MRPTTVRMQFAVLTLSFLAIVIGATVQIAAVTGWRMGERRLPALSAAARRLLTAASALVALGCAGFAGVVVSALGEAGHECARLSQTEATNVGVALALSLTTTAAFSVWAAHRSMHGKRCGAALGWEVGAGFLAFLLFAWLLGGTSC